MKIIIDINRKISVKKVAYCAEDISDKVYKTLTKYGIDETEAMECARWWKTPRGYSEKYNGKNFSVHQE